MAPFSVPVLQVITCTKRGGASLGGWRAAREARGDRAVARGAGGTRREASSVIGEAACAAAYHLSKF